MKNNSAFNAMISKYKNNNSFNLYLNKSQNVEGGLTSATKYPSNHKTIDRAETYSYFPTSSAPFKENDDMQYTELGMVTVVAHEAIHQRIASVDVRDEDAQHNIFNNYMKALTNILNEYNTDNKLGLTSAQIKEVALSGQQKSAGFKNYINGLAKENGTSYKAEKASYDKRISDLLYEKKQTQQNQ